MMGIRAILAFSVLFLVSRNKNFAFGFEMNHFLSSKAVTAVPPIEDRLSCCDKSRREALLCGFPLGGAFLGGLSVSALPPKPCIGLSPQDAANDYDSYASTYDNLDGGEAASTLGIDEARSQLLSQAKGNVLEIGVGTGLNLEKYDPRKISSLTLVDISDGMLQEAKGRFDGLKSLQDVPVKFVKADATSELIEKFGRGTFDTVVDSFSLCVFGNEGAKQGLEQLKSVVKDEASGGLLLLLENSRSSNPLLGLYQDVTADAAASIGGKGCVYNQDVGRLLRAASINIQNEGQYAAGVFRSFVCTVS